RHSSSSDRAATPRSTSRSGSPATCRSPRISSRIAISGSCSRLQRKSRRRAPRSRDRRSRPRPRSRTSTSSTRPLFVEVAGQLELVLRRLRELAAGALVDDALQQLGAELFVGAVAGLDQPEAEGVERLVGNVLLACELLGDRVALRG